MPAANTPQHLPVTTPSTGHAPIVISGCCLVMIAALVGGVGIPDGLVLRHVVQTLPLWPAIVLGFRRSRATGWLALPCYIFWLTLMSLIWLYLLGVCRVITGHFSPLEIAMTIVVGLASVVGIVAFARYKSGLSPFIATALFIIFAAIQWACFRASLLPSIAHR